VFASPGGCSASLGTPSLPRPLVVFDTTIDRFVELARVVPSRSAGRGRQIGISRGDSEPNKPGRRGRPPGTRAAELSAGRDRPQSQRLSTPFDPRAIVPGVGRVGECFQDPESSGTADREGSRLLRKPWAPAPAHCYIDLLQGMADRLGIDLELLADRDTRESRGVQKRLVRCRQGSGHALVSIPRARSRRAKAVVRRIACLPASKTAVAPARQPATSRFDPSGGIRRWTCLEPRPTRRCDMVRGHSSCPVAQVGSFPYSTLRHLSRSGAKQANLPGSSRNNCREYRAVPVARASFRPLRASYTCGRV